MQKGTGRDIKRDRQVPGTEPIGKNPASPKPKKGTATKRFIFLHLSYTFHHVLTNNLVFVFDGFFMFRSGEPNILIWLGTFYISYPDRYTVFSSYLDIHDKDASPVASFNVLESPKGSPQSSCKTVWLLKLYFDKTHLKYAFRHLFLIRSGAF
jgi:hypothetical protein